uniref:Uncharacterized protein n=1 Tax=viral metagenome TaxID=1070528 RepID=A0A6C0K0Q1_9ZZZZ
MGSHPSKLRCLILPAQSGKTRKAEDLIRLFKEHEKRLDEASIDIWVSANNKLLVHQTTSRLKKDLGTAEVDSDAEEEGESNAVIKEDIFSWTSGTKASNIPADTLAWDCVDNVVGMIIVCAHKRRLDYIERLVKRLQKHKFPKKINIWIDEADYSCRLWMKFKDLAASPLVNEITLVSATFGEVFKHFPSLKVIPYKETSLKIYRRLIHCKLIEEGTGREAADKYVEAVLKKYPALSTPGMRAFIPGNINTISHEDISELLIKKGFAVLVLNGEHKEIRFPKGKEPVDLRPYLTVTDPKAPPAEFNKTLAELYVKHELAKFPLAITGFLCVERGITFQSAPAEGHDGFLFDYAIVCSIKEKAEAYQAMARVFGNIGGFNKDKCCTIYSDSKTFEKVRDQEETAVHIAHMAWERKERGESTEVTVMDLKNASHYEAEKDWIVRVEEFETLEDAHEFIASFPKVSRSRTPTIVDGFYHSSMKNKLQKFSCEEILTELKGWTKFRGYAETGDSEKLAFTRLFVGYRDVEDPSTAVFIVRATEKVRKRRLVRKVEKKRKLIRK